MSKKENPYKIQANKSEKNSFFEETMQKLEKRGYRVRVF